MKKIYLFIALILFSNFGVAMSVFDAGKVCTFSKITGVIVEDGKPVVNALVERTTDYNSKKSDETYTDSDGRFELPALFERSAGSLLPQEFVVGQTIFISTKNGRKQIWEGIKRSKKENSESRGEPLDVQCDLNSETKVIKVDGQVFMTLCSWDVEADINKTGF